MKIKATKRDLIGKTVSKIRGEGFIPAAVYGPNRESLAITLDKKEFTKQYKTIGHNVMADMMIEGEAEHGKVLVKEVQKNPLTGDLTHVSLYEIDMKQNLDVEVPVEVIGVSAPVKNGLGFLVTAVTSVLVTCKPNNIPEKLVVDITPLEQVNDAVHLGDLELGEGVTLHSSMSPEMVVVRISPPQKEIVEEAPVEAELAEGEEGEKKEGESTEGESKDDKDSKSE